MGTGKINRARLRVAALAAAFVAAALALAGSAAGTGKYADKTGDGGATFDITGAQVASDASGQISFRVDVANITAGVRYMIATYGVDTLENGGRRSSSGGYVGY